MKKVIQKVIGKLIRSMKTSRADVLNRLIKKYNCKSVCEIGVWKGENLFKLAKDNKNVMFTGVDPYDSCIYEDKPNSADYLGDLEEIKKDVLKKAILFDNVRIICHTSKKASEYLKDFDLIFIDGEHTYNAVKHDIEIWLPKTNKVISGHDFSVRHFGVIKAVTERFEYYNYDGDKIWWCEVKNEKYIINST